MPIYACRCASCGHAQDVLQKVSDPLLTICPACGVEALQKQVTAAGFQLKGSGWYVTDFRGGSAAPAAGDSKESQDAKPAGDKAAPAPAPAPAAAGAAPAPAPSPAPAPAPSGPTAATS